MRFGLFTNTSCPGAIAAHPAPPRIAMPLSILNCLPATQGWPITLSSSGSWRRFLRCGLSVQLGSHNVRGG